MKRLIEQDIINRSENENALPLFILGARQVGKTYLVQKFTKSYFTNSLFI